MLELQRSLAQMARQVGPAADLAEVLDRVLAAMRSLIEFRSGAIQLRDERGVYVAAADPDVGDELKAFRVPIGTGLPGQVVQTGETIYSPDVWVDDRVESRQVALDATAHSHLVVPLVLTGEVIGALQIDSADVDAFDADDVALLEGLAVYVAPLIEEARRHESDVELERMKSDFIARISHELRTPLTIMGGFTDTLLLHGDRLDAEQRAEVLTRVKASVARLSALIEEILTVTSLEAGMTQVKLADAHIGSILESVRDLSIDASRVELSCPDDLYLVTDAVILRHVINQLVDNALKYAGRATVVAKRTGDSALEISVTDDGPGIPESERKRIFQRFYRGNHTGAGMGLGLPAARDLSQRLGATLELEAPPEGGARFTVRFA